MLTLPRDVCSRSMMSSIDRLWPVMNRRPWIWAIVGLMPQRPAMLRQRSTNSCSTSSSGDSGDPAGSGCMALPLSGRRPLWYGGPGAPIKGAGMAAVRVKICGVTTAEDAQAAVALGADAIGLNFHPPSPRCVSLAAARGILDALPPAVQAIGVFVD